MSCPKCSKTSKVQCDNDCGTSYCERCRIDYFAKHGGTSVFGHAPLCGKERFKNHEDEQKCTRKRDCPSKSHEVGCPIYEKYRC